MKAGFRIDTQIEQQISIKSTQKKYILKDQNQIKLFKQNNQEEYLKSPIEYQFNESMLKVIGTYVSSNLIKQQRQKKIEKNFARKLKRSLNNKQINEQNIKLSNLNKCQKLDGFDYNYQKDAYFKNIFFNNLFRLIKFLSLLLCFFISSLKLPYNGDQQPFIQIAFKILLILIILLELLLKYLKLNQFFKQSKEKLIFYLQNNKQLIILVLIIFTSIIIFEQAIQSVTCTILLYQFIKSSMVIQKLVSLTSIISNMGYYWDIIKIFLFNFFIAHCLSIILNIMTELSIPGEKSWYYLKNLENSSWSQKYVWGFYWGTTIMLTVGFGDISANNWKQALCLTYIQTFSCIILAYNISEVSKVIQKMRQPNIQKNHKLKVFHKYSKNNTISNDLSNRVKNYIQKSIEMKQRFNIDQQKDLLNQLPEKLVKQLKNQINQNSFVKIPLFNNFTNKCQKQISENIVKVMTHPQQIIIHKGEVWKMILLNEGQLGLAYSRDKSSLNGRIIDRFKLIPNKLSQLISTGFLWQDQLYGDLKSLSFSILGTIDKYILENILKMHSPNNFEYYCFLRDKMRDYPDETYSTACEQCKQENHSRAKCYKIHYSPLSSLVISKYIKKIKPLKGNKQKRKQLLRREKIKRENVPLKQYKQLQNVQMTEVVNNIRYLQCSKRTKEKTRTSSKYYNMMNISNINSSGAQLNEKIQFMLSGILQLNRKVDKCHISQLQTLQFLKGQSQNQQFDIDRPWNYKYYFKSFNPDYLVKIYPGITLQNKKSFNLTKTYSNFRKWLTFNERAKSK